MNKFEEIQYVYDRADEHLGWLSDHIIHPDENLVPEKFGYQILEDSGDVHVGKMRVVIGEYATCLRNALNYATMIMAEQETGSSTVGNSVQFPIDDSEKIFKGHVCRYLKGIKDPNKIAFFEAKQPYKARNRLALLRDLTNVHRHRELIAVKKVFQRPERFTEPAETKRVGRFKMEVRYDFTVAVAFPNGGRILEALNELRAYVPQVVEEFRPHIRKWLSLNDQL